VHDNITCHSTEARDKEVSCRRGQELLGSLTDGILVLGWERHYSGLSDSDLTNAETRLRPRNSLSPDKDFMGDFGDSDMESVVSVTSSAFSTQSERPRGSKGLR
jgi:hypothetical protein